MALRTLLFVLLVIAPGILSAQNETASYQSAFTEFKTGQYEKALKVVDVLLAKDPKSAQHHELRGRILHGLKRYDDAVEEYYLALKLDPKRVENHYYLGEAAFAQGYWPEAVEFYRVHLATAGKQPKTRLKLIYCQAASGNLSEAAKQVPFLDPGDDIFPGYYYGQTAIYLAEARNPKVSEAEKKALEKKANDLMRQVRTLYGNHVANGYEVEMLRIFKKSDSISQPPDPAKHPAAAEEKK